MGALDWVYQGTLNAIHPAATILFLLFVLASLVLRKSFCGWICPVGFLSEWLGRAGMIVMKLKRPMRVPKGLDFVLRGLKYLLLGFFVWAIFSMTAMELHAFIVSPYNKVSDVKMLEFFRTLSLTGAIVIGVLAVASFFIHSFWCRYLCPYGALMGLFSWMSPTKVRRDPDTCTDCNVCNEVCPARLPVMQKKSITSVECIGCTDCVTSCPVPGALRFGTKKRSITPRTIAIALVLILLIGTTAARIGGVWHNDLTDAEIRHHVARMHSGEYGHPGMNGE